MSISANLETGWVETLALISAKLTPTLPQSGARQVMLWLQTFQVYFPRVCCAQVIPSGMTVRDKTPSHRESDLPGNSCPVQVEWYSEPGTVHIIPYRPGRLSIKTCSALHSPYFD